MIGSRRDDDLAVETMTAVVPTSRMVPPCTRPTGGVYRPPEEAMQGGMARSRDMGNSNIYYD